MKPRNKTVAFLIILAQTVVGLGVVLLAKIIPTPFWLSPSVLVLLLFMALNVALAYLLNIKNELKNYWSLRKSYFLLLGLVGGLVIAVFPSLAALIFGEISFEEIGIRQAISFRLIALTLVIVAWEELWFRGVLLNFCQRKMSATTISIFVGLLFMLVHLLNPNFNLFNSGLTLFFAGTFLTVSYFYYKSIWLPLGLHFGNNVFSNLCEVEFKNELFYGSDGYFSALLLAILTLIFWEKLNKSQPQLSTNSNG